jgi:hypothetical protein
MNGNLTSQLTAIKKNLDLQLEDLALQQKEKIGIELFFDNADIHDAVLGARAFYPPFTTEEFDSAKFSGKRTLVRSLASSGWLGKIRLFPPHQTEFLGQLNLYFGVGIPRDPRGDARNFLADLGIKPPKVLENQTIERLTKEQMEEFIKQEAGSAERLFKAVQCIVPWHRRLPRWETQKLLDFELGRTNYEEIIQNDDFIRLKKEFDNRRPNASIPNFADAAVITILIERVKKIKEGKAESVPRFFVPTSLFQDVIDQSGVGPHLAYKNILGEMSSVICNSDYFIYKAAFLPREISAVDADSKLEEVEENLRDLRARVVEVLDAQEKITVDAVAKIVVRGRSLRDIMKDLRQVAFLENVWLKYQAPQEAYQALQDIIDASREKYESEAFREGVTKAKTTIEAKLQKNAQEFKWISSMWMRLEKASQDLRGRINFDPKTSVDFFRDFGLFRFSFPDDTHESIRNLLEKILQHGEEERAARVSVVSDAYRSRENPDGELKPLIEATAVMMALQMYDELFKLLDKIKPLQHFSLRLVQTEVLFMLRRSADQSIANIDELEEEYKTTDDPIMRGDLAMGIASLYFYLWRTNGFEPTWRPHRQMTIDPEQVETGRGYIKKAAKYAKDAFDLINNNQIKKVFALNMYLYFMIEGDGAARRQEIEAAAQMLSTYKRDRATWLHTFDDTLARYFHLLASLSSSADEWNELMKQAQIHSQEARAGSHGNEDIAHYSTLLAVVKSAGFQAGSSVDSLIP